MQKEITWACFGLRSANNKEGLEVARANLCKGCLDFFGKDAVRKQDGRRLLMLFDRVSSWAISL